jgi:hypothetical protein
MSELIEKIRELLNLSSLNSDILNNITEILKTIEKIEDKETKKALLEIVAKYLILIKEFDELKLFALYLMASDICKSALSMYEKEEII